MQATYLDGGVSQTATLIVHAREADFGAPFAVYVNNLGIWKLPNVAPDLELEWDGDVIATETAQPPAGGREAGIFAISDGDRHVVARAGENRAILARGTVSAYRIYGPSDTGGASVEEVYEDGDRHIRTSVVVDGLPEGGYAEAVIFISGVTFLDGTTVKRLEASDFDAHGVAYLDFNFPDGAHGSVCHHIYVFDAEGNTMGVIW